MNTEKANEAAYISLKGEFTRRASLDLAAFGLKAKSELLQAKLSEPLPQYIIMTDRGKLYLPSTDALGILQFVHGYTYFVIVDNNPKAVLTVHQVKQTNAWETSDISTVNGVKDLWSARERVLALGAKREDLKFIVIPDGPYTLFFLGWGHDDTLRFLPIGVGNGRVKFEREVPITADQLLKKIGIEETVKDVQQR